jgi:Sec-independent protein translocase protein TatA
MGSVGFEEMLVIAIVAIIVWGDRLPQMARKAARIYAQLRNYMFQMRDEVMRQIPDEKTIFPDVNEPTPPQMMPTYMDPSDPDFKSEQSNQSEQKDKSDSPNPSDQADKNHSTESSTQSDQTDKTDQNPS